MERTLIDMEVKNTSESTLKAEENAMMKMGETLEDIIHTTESMMDAVKEISDIVNS